MLMMQGNLVDKMLATKLKPQGINKYYVRKKRTNQKNAQINFGLMNLLLFNHSNMFRPLNRSHHQGVQNP